jgi:hypothetical protein
MLLISRILGLPAFFSEIEDSSTSYKCSSRVKVFEGNGSF